MTGAEKSAMYAELQSDLTKAALRLKKFAEDESLFVENQLTSEQESARRSYQQLTEMIGRFAIESAENEEE